MIRAYYYNIIDSNHDSDLFINPYTFKTLVTPNSNSPHLTYTVITNKIVTLFV